MLFRQFRSPSPCWPALCPPLKPRHAKSGCRCATGGDTGEVDRRSLGGRVDHGWDSNGKIRRRRGAGRSLRTCAGASPGWALLYAAAGVIVEDAAAHTTGAGDDVVVLAGIGGIGEQHHEVESTTFRVIANAFAGESSSPPQCCCSSTRSECAEPGERESTTY